MSPYACHACCRHVFAIFADRVAAALKSLYPEVTEEALARLVVEPPRDAAHGDLSSNAAMVVAKPLGKNPREIATALAGAFKNDKDVASVEVAGPGFLNFRLAGPIWFSVLRSIAAEGERFSLAFAPAPRRAARGEPSD